MKIKRQQVIVAALILLGLAFLVLGVLYREKPRKYYAHSLRTWQEADSVAGYPIAVNGVDEGSPLEFKTATFQPNLSTMSALERFLLPTTHGFERPTGGDARAAARGLVLYSGEAEGYPGFVVLLGHRLPDGTIVQTFYTGLSLATADVGRILPRGASLGEGGALAEIRKGSAIDVACEPVAGHRLNHHEAPAPANRLDPDKFFAQFGLTHSRPDPLALIREKEFQEARDRLEIQTK